MRSVTYPVHCIVYIGPDQEEVFAALDELFFAWKLNELSLHNLKNLSTLHFNSIQLPMRSKPQGSTRIPDLHTHRWQWNMLPSLKDVTCAVTWSALCAWPDSLIGYAGFPATTTLWSPSLERLTYDLDSRKEKKPSRSADGQVQVYVVEVE